MDLIEERRAKQREWSRAWRERNPERYREINKKSRDKNIEAIRARNRARYHATKHLIPAPTEEVRARKLAANREWRLKQYGLTSESYRELFDKQGGVCAICGKPDPTHPNLAVDHCHYSGKVRGLLCRVCNPAIGALGDTQESIERAVRYLSQELAW